MFQSRTLLGAMAEVINFSADQTRDHLSMKELIYAVERGLGNFSDHENGGVVQPVRTVFKVDNIVYLPSGYVLLG